MTFPLRFPLILMVAALPGPAQSRLLQDADFERMAFAIQSQTWASKAHADLIAAAEAWPASHLARYGLPALALPPEGGQWRHWYVCPNSGVRLRFEAPDRHICPTDNRRVTGWPYDQVIYAERHDQIAVAAHDLALAFRLTGKSAYAERSAWILKAYAETYLTYELHDNNNRNTRNGARAHSQTLNESIWIIPLAYAFDLLGDALSAEDRDAIERGLLRPAAETIRRYDAGTSNWQAWHNAGVAAIAFALGDDELARHAIDGPSGFRFHLRRSVTPDGLWYEGSFTYHYYALDALISLAEIAGRNDVDLWQEEAFRQCFAAPLRFSFADGTLAPFNDAATVNVRSYAAMYESAFRHWGDPLYAWVAASRPRGRDALIFGEPELPAGSAPGLESTIFSNSGYAVLRAAANDHALILKYGPHGGGHGHYDKLNFVSYFNGGILAVDPGTQAYGAPTHNTWDKATVAHNTVVVDERNQAEASGSLLFSDFAGSAAIARASAGRAYANAGLARSIVHTADYALDIFDVQSTDAQDHTFDWVYHNAGVVKTDLSLGTAAGLGRQNGYQHLTNTRAATTSADWTLTFDGTTTSLGSYGSLFASTANVRGAFLYSRDQAFQGLGSARLAYQFNGTGYLLYSTPAVTGQSATSIPRSVKLAIYGDGSRHRLLLRINDASDERFVTPLAVVDWTGWREFEIADPAKWPTRFLGNNDGVVDLPIRTVSLELQQDGQGPRQGDLYVDQIELTHDGGNFLVANFEVTTRSLRVWMLGAESTTVFTGNGLGPDLTKPVPFVLARRRGRQTRYVTLLEPFDGAAPHVTAFRQEGETIVITGPGWEDRIDVSADGIPHTRR